MTDTVKLQAPGSPKFSGRAENMLARLLALEISRTAESIVLVAREASERRLSTGQLGRTLATLRKDLDHVAALI
jgi:hypothetical protein